MITRTRPTHRVSFSRIIEGGGKGRETLGPAREIGAIWPRKDNKAGGVLRFDHIPVELSRHQGVVFVVPVDG